MERIRQMTDTRRCAFLWAVTVLLTAALLFLCGGKVHAQEEDDNGEWVDETNCTRALNGKTRIVLPCYEDVHCRAAMTYQNERVETTGLAGIKVTSPDEDIVSVYDNNENYEEISSVSGNKVGTVNLTCAFQSRTGETVYTETLPCDVAKFEAGRDNARYDSYGMCVLYNTDVEIFAKTTIKVPKKQKKAYQKFLKTKGIGKGVKIK